MRAAEIRRMTTGFKLRRVTGNCVYSTHEQSREDLPSSRQVFPIAEPSIIRSCQHDDNCTEFSPLPRSEAGSSFA